jgi:anti-anti-sigma factor
MADTPDSSSTALAICGEFTVFTAAALKASLIDAIAQAETADIAIDLAGVTEIDSAGVQLMVMAKREAASYGKNLHFIGHSGPVLDLIDLCDLSGFFGDPLLIRSGY